MAAGEILGIAGNITESALNNVLSGQISSTARAENYSYNEKAARNADKRTRALYADFYSPEALMRQYREAGLSPSMMFGGTPGQGGMAGAQGQGTAGQATPFAPMSMVEAAQAASLFAQAEKTKEETKTERAENKKGIALLANIGADTQNKTAQADLAKVTGDWQLLQNTFFENTEDLRYEEIEENVEMLRWNAKSAKWAAKREKLNYEWNQEVYDNGVNPYMEEVNNMIADTLLKGAQKNLSEEQKKEVTQHIQYMMDDIYIRTMHLNNETFLVDYDKNLKEAEAEYYKKAKEIMGEVTNQQEFDKWLDLGSKLLTGALQVASLYFIKGKVPMVTPPGMPRMGGKGNQSWY